MLVVNHNRILAQEEVHKYFALEGSRLYRKLATGAATQLKSRDGNQVVTLFKNQRLLAVDIAWCLIYGNWPMFPIAQVSANPMDFSEGNLWPARQRRWRYVQTLRHGMYFHPLSQFGHTTAADCRADWEDCARGEYRKDMAYVLRLESAQREMREKALRETRAIHIPVKSAERVKRSPRPRAVTGMEWHWYNEEWVSVPVACHVADDYRVRVIAWLAGARTFRFDLDARRVFAYMPDGTRWQAPEKEPEFQLALF